MHKIKTNLKEKKKGIYTPQRNRGEMASWPFREGIPDLVVHTKPHKNIEHM